MNIFPWQLVSKDWNIEQSTHKITQTNCEIAEFIIDFMKASGKVLSTIIEYTIDTQPNESGDDHQHQSDEFAGMKECSANLFLLLESNVHMSKCIQSVLNSSNVLKDPYVV